ncbi:MAG: FAD-dependent thymidylate synthase [Candidatus Cloacimonetes bacterium]|nr:FAD-dependent thymidylate synthase [Candidatus Cloacimonadota bacterium]
MIVKIAGYNIDKSLIDKLNLPQKATPETISAAYARISRSKKTVSELRQDAIKEVEKARQSNEKIIFDMGHSSIAEHAVFNFDIIGISRYLTEYIQKSRLASFTEKSQRYVTWESNYYTPPELANSKLKDTFQKKVTTLFDLYKELFETANSFYKKNSPELSPRKREEMAKEDARYVLPLATETQMGVTINARSLENLLRRLANLELTEAKTLYDALIAQVKELTPSLIRYIEPDLYKKNLNCLGKNFRSASETDSLTYPVKTKVKVLTTDAEELILASFLFQENPQDLSNLINKIKKISASEIERLFSCIFQDMKAYHQAPKNFELVECMVQTSISASCFAQLKRHRMATIIRSNYQPRYGYVIPPIFNKTGSAKHISKILAELATLYEDLEKKKKDLGSYILTNAHRINLLFKTNLREMYHFSRLRSDSHAQWEIRELSLDIDQELLKMLPNAAKLLMGKDRFQYQ